MMMRPRWQMTLLKSERICLFEEKEKQICGYIWISERGRTDRGVFAPTCNFFQK
jgi:hypothetical protein